MTFTRRACTRAPQWWIGATLGLALMAAAGKPVGTAIADDAPGDAVIELAIGGDIGLGNRMNSYIPRQGASAVLADRVSALTAADLAIANLEGIVTEEGVRGVDKGQIAPLYFRARPEMLEVLEAAEISGVTTGNNHSGDYGPEALLDQSAYLEQMGIAHPGAGSNSGQACDPAYLSAEGLVVAYFSVDTTQPRFAATTDSPGTCYLDAAEHSAWEAKFGRRIAVARERAHVVLFFVHWGGNFETAPSSATRDLARAIVQMGVDAVIGGNAHRLQGVEIIDGRPVIYDVGTLLFDFPEPHDAALWTLSLSARGVERTAATALISEPGWTRMADPAESQRILGYLSDQSEALGTTLSDGVVEFHPPERAGPSSLPPHVAQADGEAPPPSGAPPSECVAESVPSHATPLDLSLGDVRLLGAAIEPQSLVGPAMIWVKTYWTTDRPLERGLWILPRGDPAGNGLTSWGDAHEPCDWRWPADRWRPGEIYVDLYPLRPADSILRLGGLPALLAGGFSGPLEVRVAVEVDSRLIGESPVLARVEMAPPIQLQLAVGFAAAMGAAVVAWIAFLLRRWRARRTIDSPG